MARITTGVRNLARGFGGATLFNGSTSVIKRSSQSAFNLNTYSISFWINATAQANDKYIFSEGSSAGTSPIAGLRYLVSGSRYKIGAFIRNDAGSNLVANDFTLGNLVHGRWYHVTATFNNGVTRCYVNGIYTGLTYSYAQTAITLDQTAIGALWRTNTSNYFTGKLAEVKIFNSALTASQATELYSTGSVSGVSPVASYALDDQPYTYIDSIGGINGTGTDTALVTTGLPMQARVAATNRVYLSKQYIPTPYMDEDAGSGYPAGWSVWTNATATYSIDAGTFVTGNGALRLTCASAVGAYKMNEFYRALSGIMPSGALKIGSTVRVFIRYKISTQAYVFVGLGKSGSYKTIVDTGSSADWTELTKDICFSSKTTGFNVDIQVKNKNTTDVATLWIDELRITHVPRTVV